MAIRTIEIVCIPCPKCAELESQIGQIIRDIEQKNEIEIKYKFKHTPHLQDISKYSVNASQAPILIINDKAELTGMPPLDILKFKLESIRKIA